MPKPIFSIILLFLLFSCETKIEKEQNKHPNWNTLTLPNGWKIQAPKGFKVFLAQGIDSNPGYIYSKSDSIELEFDSGRKGVIKKDCNLSKQVIEAKKDITSGFYKNFYKLPILHKAHIEIINNKVATIILPSKTSNGKVEISIDDCNTGNWLSVKGKNLSLQDEKLVVNIFRTLKFFGK